MTENLLITTNLIGEVTEISFSGNMDTNTAPNAQDYLHKIIDEGSNKILINFRDLDFISSAGLRVLLATGKRLTREGGSMKLCNLNETVAEVFEISGFDSIFAVYSDKEAALAGS